MWKRVAMAMVVAVVVRCERCRLRRPPAVSGLAASSHDRHRHRVPPPGTQNPGVQDMMTPVETRPGDDHSHGRHGSVVRADRRGAAGEAVVVQRVPRQLRLQQGFTDVSNWPVTFGVGLGDRAEMFGAWTPCAASIATCGRCSSPAQDGAGGVANEYPFVRHGWSGNQLGDIWLGAKVNLASQWRQQPVAVRVCAA